MKRLWIGAFVGLMLAAASAWGAEKVESPKSCAQCGMDREFFAYSRMLIRYADGTSAGVCSINCAVTELKQNKRKQVVVLLVADYAGKALMDARSATWVTGGKKPGVMTPLPKWAFAKREDAQMFVRENGGTITGFDDALDLAIKENE
ncbi:MAG TPA: nitrous oxide reductase accessory protein NosL [Geobacteraceae bacterium]|nr:nitrous oxide reductase accessory protein NosL [Geobacteraceae bacterium]